MKAERIEGRDERDVLAGMITLDVVAARVADRWPADGQMFASDWVNLVGGWVVAYVRRYGAAPGAAIRRAFDRWAAGRREGDPTVAAVRRFLEGLSADVGSLPASAAILDLAGEVATRVSVRRALAAAEAELDAGRVDAAAAVVERFGRVELGGCAAVDPLNDPGPVVAAFDRHAVEPLIPYRGALGRFLGEETGRDSFLSFIAPEKRGKSWWLLDAAFVAARARRRVAFFAAGDMSEHQIIRRLSSRLLRRPLRAGEVRVPTSLTVRGGESSVTWETRSWSDDVSAADVLAASAAWRSSVVRSDESRLRLSVWPAGVLSVAEIRTRLDGWSRDGWNADVVVIDYADLLAPPAGPREERDKINATWKALRCLSQEKHLCLLTATQSDADGYDRGTLTRRNFSEDKRKLAHVTGMIGLNQSEPERKQGVYRLNWIVVRERPDGPFSHVWCAGALGLGNPAIRSAVNEHSGGDHDDGTAV